MEVGVQLPHIGYHASPAYVRDYAQAAEALGFDSVWVADHVAVPRRADSVYTLLSEPVVPPEGALSGILGTNLECLTTLAFVAGITSRVRLGTSVAVLPLRHPVLNAKMLASVDAYSGGRLVYGVGAGWLREEVESLGMPWDHRGVRMEEHIAILRLVWSTPEPFVEYRGTYYDFQEIDVNPRPVQPLGPPILVGGHSDAALERAGRIGDGWIASRMDVERLDGRFARVKAAATAAGRDPAELKLYTNVDFSVKQDSRRHAIANDPQAAPKNAGASGETVAGMIEQALAYARAGVHHLKFSARLASATAELAWLEQVAEHVLPSVRDTR